MLRRQNQGMPARRGQSLLFIMAAFIGMLTATVGCSLVEERMKAHELVNAYFHAVNSGDRARMAAILGAQEKFEVQVHQLPSLKHPTQGDPHVESHRPLHSKTILDRDQTRYTLTYEVIYNDKINLESFEIRRDVDGDLKITEHSAQTFYIRISMK